MKGYKSETFSVLCQYKFIAHIFQDDREKCGKLNLNKKNIWCAIRSNTIKVKLDLYYVNTNSYMKFQVTMSKDDKEKSGKRNFSKGQSLM